MPVRIKKGEVEGMKEVMTAYIFFLKTLVHKTWQTFFFFYT